MADKIARKGKEILDEKIVGGGGATGVATVPDTSSVKKAQAPGNSKTQGELQSKKLEGDVEDTDPQNNSKPTGDMSAKNKSSVSMKEDVEEMFAGQDLSEEFKEKATVVFEAAVNTKCEQIRAELEEQYVENFAQARTELEEELSTKIDEYLSYVVEQWMDENQVAIETSLRTELTEEFITDLKALFEEHNISIPEDKVDVVEELAARVEELESKLNEQIDENIELKKVTDEVARHVAIADVSEGLAATQIEKFEALCEGVAFDDEQTFKKKLAIIKENYFPSDKRSSQLLSEQVDDEQDEETQSPVASGTMAHYASAIRRTIKK